MTGSPSSMEQYSKQDWNNAHASLLRQRVTSRMGTGKGYDQPAGPGTYYEAEWLRCEIIMAANDNLVHVESGGHKTLVSGSNHGY